MKIDRSFYKHNSVLDIARELLGKVMVTQIGEVTTSARIVETEAYSYTERACHAYDNKYTKRTRVMFSEGGTSYVYLCYGIHKLFNIVTNEEGVAEAVLIRAVEPDQGVSHMLSRRNFSKIDYSLTSGPGKLTKALGIDMQHNELDLTKDQVWLEDDGHKIEPQNVSVSARIGVGYAGEDARLPWRFFVRDNRYVSKGRNVY